MKPTLESSHVGLRVGGAICYGPAAPVVGRADRFRLVDRLLVQEPRLLAGLERFEEPNATTLPDYGVDVVIHAGRKGRIRSLCLLRILHKRPLVVRLPNQD